MNTKIVLRVIATGIALSAASAPTGASAGIIALCVGQKITSGNFRQDSIYRISDIKTDELAERKAQTGESDSQVADSMLDDLCDYARSRSDEIGYYKSSVDYGRSGYYHILARKYRWNGGITQIIGIGFGSSARSAEQNAYAEATRRGRGLTAPMGTQHIENGRF